MPFCVSAITLILLLSACQGQTPNTPVAARTTPGTSAGEPRSGAAVLSYADVVARVAPAVVTVRSERRVRAPQMFPFSSDPRLREFFGDRGGGPPTEPQDRLQRGLGSGVIVRADGHILTNHHVVDGAEDIRIELLDGRRIQAKLVGSDPASDVAVLKVDAPNLPVIELGDSETVRIGDIVLALGNPLGIGQTVTAGIISAKNRSTGVGEGSYEDFLQTDAPINQGNSGGALVNSSGQLIGINSQILSTSGGSIGIGFAIPANMARNVMDQLVEHGRVRRGQLGVGIQPLSPELASSLGVTGDVNGVLINSVSPGSPAERAGLRRGDIITALNGEPVADPNSLRNRVAAAGPGAEIEFAILRDGNKQSIKARLAEMSADAAAGDAPGQSGAPSSSPTGAIGIAVEPVPSNVATRLRLPSNQGLLVRGVDPAGPAASSGIAPGDVLVEAARQPLRAVSDLTAVLGKSTGKPVALLVNRNGQTFFITVTPRAQ